MRCILRQGTLCVGSALTRLRGALTDVDISDNEGLGECRKEDFKFVWDFVPVSPPTPNPNCFLESPLNKSPHSVSENVFGVICGLHNKLYAVQLELRILRDENFTLVDRIFDFSSLLINKFQFTSEEYIYSGLSPSIVSIIS